MLNSLLEATENAIDWSSVWTVIVNWVTSTGLRLLVALILLFISFKLINFVTKKIYNDMMKRGRDLTLTKVLHTVLRVGFKILVFVSLVGYVGIETASVSALIASVGLGISMAVQGTLGNFAGGILIIVMHPFKIGDFITSGDYSGTVEDIGLFYTQMVTPDNKLIHVPNGTLSNNVIVNVSAKETRRCDVVMSVAYGSDTDLVRSVILGVCKNCELIFQDPAPFVEIGEFAESSINFFVRVYCKNTDYWTVNFYLLKEIKNAFDANGIEIPFNQLDVTIKQ